MTLSIEFFLATFQNKLIDERYWSQHIKRWRENRNAHKNFFSTQFVGEKGYGLFISSA